MKRRNECFFGLHNDFHAVPEEGCIIGDTLREEDIRELCETLKPDFIQIDCKGHPGWASYPSKLGNAMPRFAIDPLKLWRQVTSEYGVALFMHYSGIYDKKYCEDHPESRILRADGSYANIVRFESRYAEELLIPQVSELVREYGIDGIWIDGDVWSVHADYHPETLQKFFEKTGIDIRDNPPKKAGDAHFTEYIEFTRERYREFLRYYVDKLHKLHPELQICANWVFSDHMPEAVSANVDFLSGDLNPANCVNSARYAGRMLAQQNKPWDLMSWHFRYMRYGAPLIPPKHVCQIMQEAAAVISLGGAFQDNIGQFKDGSPNIEQIRSIKPLADFMHEREDFCFGTESVHEAALLVSTHDLRSTMTRPFARERNDEFISITALLCDSGLSLETVSEHTLRGNTADYPLIIVPELRTGLDESLMKELCGYAADGGRLLLIGNNTAKLFAEAGFPYTCEDLAEAPVFPNFSTFDNGHLATSAAKDNPCYIRVNGGECGQANNVTCINGTCGKTIATAHSDLRGEGKPFAAMFTYGKGRIAVIGTNLALQYKDGAQYQHRQLIKLASELLYTPAARIESATGIVEISLRKKGERLLLQLVNGNGRHADVSSMTENFIVPVLDLQISVATEGKPLKITLQPEGRVLEYEYRDSRVYFTVDRLDIHSVAEITVR